MALPKDIIALYYLTHIDNVESILRNGILSHNKSSSIKSKKIYNEEVIERRKRVRLPNNEHLTNYANLYFQPKNPMLYSVLNEVGEGNIEKGCDSIVLLAIRKEILDDASYVSPANAATYLAEFLDCEKGIRKIESKILKDDFYWNDLSGGKAKAMAECLVKDCIPANKIISVYCGTEKAQKRIARIKEQVNLSKLEVVLDKVKFFLPNKFWKLQETKITLEIGDMFFCQAKTLSISVNIKGVMGKGLASRTRYQFPDVFVEYQDLCRYKKLKMGKPYLVKRNDKSVDDLFFYNPSAIETKNNKKWFLLFPTKDHWKDDSDLTGIEKGLQWVVDWNKKESFESIAFPALGCGLGNLSWKEIGPLMCRYLVQLNIPVRIYLPLNQDIPDEQRSVEFLLGQGRDVQGTLF